MMTNKEYSKGGNKCPVCGGNDLNSDGLHNDGNVFAVQVLDCYECKARWAERYRLYEYKILSHTSMPQLQIETMKAARLKS